MKLTSVIFAAAVAVAMAGDFRTETRDRTVCADFSAIAKCTDNQVPTRGTDGCPSCLKELSFGRGKDCKKTRCDAIRTCDANEEITREGCCPSCRIPRENAKACSDSAVKAACATAMQAETFPICTITDAESNLHFNKTICCPTCKHPPRNTSNACTHDDFETCMKADTTPECGADEIPVKVDGQCCMSCRRPASKEKISRITKCGNIPECGANEKPAPTKDANGQFSCPTCKPAKQACKRTCGKSEVCARKLDGAEATCHRSTNHKIKLTPKDPEATTDVSGSDADDIEAVLVETVQRYCDMPEHAAECANAETPLVDGINVTIVESDPASGNVVVDVTVPEGDAAATDATGRRLLSTASDLLNNAVSASSDASLSLALVDKQSVNGSTTLAPVALVSAFVAFSLCTLSAL